MPYLNRGAPDGLEHTCRQAVDAEQLWGPQMLKPASLTDNGRQHLQEAPAYSQGLAGSAGLLKDSVTNASRLSLNSLLVHQEAQAWATEERQRLQQQGAEADERESKAKQLLENAAGNVDSQTRQLLHLEASVKLNQQQAQACHLVISPAETYCSCCSHANEPAVILACKYSCSALWMGDRFIKASRKGTNRHEKWLVACHVSCPDLSWL